MYHQLLKEIMKWHQNNKDYKNNKNLNNKQIHKMFNKILQQMKIFRINMDKMIKIYNKKIIYMNNKKKNTNNNNSKMKQIYKMKIEKKISMKILRRILKNNTIKNITNTIKVIKAHNNSILLKSNIVQGDLTKVISNRCSNIYTDNFLIWKFMVLNILHLIEINYQQSQHHIVFMDCQLQPLVETIYLIIQINLNQDGILKSKRKKWLQLQEDSLFTI